MQATPCTMPERHINCAAAPRQVLHAKPLCRNVRSRYLLEPRIAAGQIGPIQLGIPRRDCVASPRSRRGALPLPLVWSLLAVFGAMWLPGQNLGVGIGYHRELTHRSFPARKWLERAMATCGAMAIQGGPTYWVAVHRLHHSTPTGWAIRTHLVTAGGGLTWAGSCAEHCPTKP
jgi:hypothetical protein